MPPEIGGALSCQRMRAFLFYLLRLRRYKAKCVKTRCLQEWVGHLEPKFQGEGVVPGEYFLVSTKLDTFAIRQWKLHRATCRRFDTIPACDGRTDRRTDGRNCCSYYIACNASIARDVKLPQAGRLQLRRLEQTVTTMLSQKQSSSSSCSRSQRGPLRHSCAMATKNS